MSSSAINYPQKLTQQIGLCKDAETEKFDLRAGETWIYPTNYPIRDYQFNIIQTALYNNTLISLPTGLGKTFIAAVVMYNFYRWYPFGKIIFMAPTRPLVKQQIDACYDIMAIPKNVTVELTGAKKATDRTAIWSDKRVFFITPQVLRNDLSHLFELSKNIRCVVFDEAHHAKGRYAYCEIIQKILAVNPYFRVVALSATPGSTVQDIVEVVQNLLISKIEIRTENSIDVRPFVFQRKLEVIQMPRDPKIEEIVDKLFTIIDEFLKPLIQNKLIFGGFKSLTRNRILMAMKSYKQKYKEKAVSNPNMFSFMLRNFNICLILYHGLELLQRHGLRNFTIFFEDHKDRSLLSSISELDNILNDVNNYLGSKLSLNYEENITPTVSDDINFGHIKHYKLREILEEHFKMAGEESTRCIVFCEYRESVLEVYAALLQKASLIAPRIFMGQGVMSQKTQIAVIEKFRSGQCNTLVSTCIGEEGLDVGDVDLIICFDVSTKSPIRLVQRMGRTGRKREGKVIILVSPGKEHEILQHALRTKSYLNDQMQKSTKINDSFYKNNPRMIPNHLKPRCQKTFMTVADCDRKNVITEKPSIDVSEIYKSDIIKSISSSPFDFKKYLKSEYFMNIKEKKSTHTRLLTSLLDFVDSKRFNLVVPNIDLFPQINSIEKRRVVFDGFRSNSDSESKKNFKKVLTEIKNYVQSDPRRFSDNYEQTSCKMCKNNCDLESSIEIVDNIFEMIDRIDLEECKKIFENTSDVDFNGVENESIVDIQDQFKSKDVEPVRNCFKTFGLDSLNDFLNSIDISDNDESIVVSNVNSPVLFSENENDTELANVSNIGIQFQPTAELSSLRIEQIDDKVTDLSIKSYCNSKFWDDSFFDSLLKNEFDESMTLDPNESDSRSKRLCLQLNKNIDKTDLESHSSCVKNSDSDSEEFRKILFKNRKNSKVFIDDEAKQASDCTSDDLEGNWHNDDCYEDDFINDVTCVDSPSVKSKYIQSTKSPKILNGVYKIPDLRNYPTNVYSQAVTNDKDTYAYDSFCIPNDEIDYKTELSQIDVIEKQLKQKQKRKRNFKRIKLFTEDE